jgi:hypothetical protein
VLCSFSGGVGPAYGPVLRCVAHRASFGPRCAGFFPTHPPPQPSTGPSSLRSSGASEPAGRTLRARPRRCAPRTAATLTALRHARARRHLTQRRRQRARGTLLYLHSVMLPAASSRACLIGSGMWTVDRVEDAGLFADRGAILPRTTICREHRAGRRHYAGCRRAHACRRAVSVAAARGAAATRTAA